MNVSYRELWNQQPGCEVTPSPQSLTSSGDRDHYTCALRTFLWKPANSGALHLGWHGAAL